MQSGYCNPVFPCKVLLFNTLHFLFCPAIIRFSGFGLLVFNFALFTVRDKTNTPVLVDQVGNDPRVLAGREATDQKTKYNERFGYE